MSDEIKNVTLASDPVRSGENGAKKRSLGEIVIDALFDMKGAVKDGLKWLLSLFESRPSLAAALALGLAVLFLLGRLIGYDVLFFIPPKYPLFTKYSSMPILRSASWVQDFDAQRACITKAKSLSRKYVLLQVVQWLQYDDSPDRKIREVHERILYTLLPLTPITSSKQVFLEEYSGSNGASHWFGPRREVFVGGANKYQVVFDGKPGEPILLTTGAEFKYQLPLGSGRPAFREQVTVNSDQDFWFYQNVDDVICSLTQLVESRTLKLRPIGRGGKRVGVGLPDETDVLYQPTSTRTMTNSSLSVSWRDVLPGEDVGLVFSW